MHTNVFYFVSLFIVFYSLEVVHNWLARKQISILRGFGNHLLGFLLTNTGSYWKAGNGTVTLNSL